MRQLNQYETIRYSDYPNILVLFPNEVTSSVHINMELVMPNGRLLSVPSPPLPSHRFPRHFPLDPALAPSLPQLSSFYSLTCLSTFRLYYLCGYWMCSDKGFTAVGDVDGVCSSPRTLPLRYISSKSISASSLSYNLLYRPFLTYQDQAPNIDMIFLLTWNILVRNGGWKWYCTRRGSKLMSNCL